MTNDTGIPPALTPEEWASARSGDHSVSAILQYLEPEDMAPIVAWANALMPSDDPRKITREDVENAISLMAGISDPGWLYATSHPSRDETFREFGRLIAKLDALLPPEV
jgi:hypothetical protein